MSLASLFDHYRPFISKQAQKYYILLLALGNIIQAIFIVVTNNCFNHFFGLLMVGTFTPWALGVATFQYLAAVAVYTAMAGINSLIGDQLIQSLNQDVSNEYVDKWMASKTPVMAKFLKDRKVINPGGTLSYDIQEANRLTVRLGDNLLNTFFAFIAGLYGLWQLSFPLTFSWLGHSRQFPTGLVKMAISGHFASP